MVPVISSEILSGHPFFGGMGSGDYARRLKAIAPDAKILVSIRAQRRILTSVYMQYLLRGGTMSPKLFFAGDPELGFHGFRTEHFEYHRLIGLYRDLFGAANVHVITQESLKTDMDGTTRALAEFAGNSSFDGVLPTHRAAYAPSYPEYAVPLLRRINKFQKSVLTPAPAIRIGTTPNGFYRAAGFLLRRPPFSWIMAITIRSLPMSKELFAAGLMRAITNWPRWWDTLSTSANTGSGCVRRHTQLCRRRRSLQQARYTSRSAFLVPSRPDRQDSASLAAPQRVT
ncbi:MAG: hypothetical protein B7Z02_07245 [Rhodobacterales bacterium 32-67-9]|nr:MAG: hypothetical protein B7Z02_07245 [Rhodobacterales bacterium 32-67-9]